MMEALDVFANAGLWAAVLRIATPLIFGTLGELISERAGVLNLGIEGVMTFGAMIGWLTVYHGGDLWLGVLAAGLSGAVFGLLHAVMTVPLGLSQHVTGLGITLFASSLAYFIFRLAVPVSGTPPTILPFQVLHIPALSELPFFGQAVFSQTALTYLAIALALVATYVLARTPLGLAIRIVGENPTCRGGPGHRSDQGADRRGGSRQRADGYRRLLLDALCLQQLLSHHGSGAGLDLDRVGGLRLLAARAGAYWGAPLCLVRRLSASPAAYCRKGGALSGVPHDPLSHVDRRPIGDGASRAVPQALMQPFRRGER